MWSSGDGTPGSDTYENAVNAAFVPTDQDFGGALEVQKAAATQKLRYMGQTPILPGCYLRITARIKAISGDLPSVRDYGAIGDGVHDDAPTFEAADATANRRSVLSDAYARNISKSGPAGPLLL